LTTDPPLIDRRSAADVARQLRQLLALYSPWKEFEPPPDPATGAATGVSAGLIGVTARFAEVLIQRLNQVPQKNFLAYLNLLGAALQPPQPAKVPVTFLLAQGALVDALVPAGTQVAAPPGAGETDPVIYETEHELIATSAQLAYVFVRDPGNDAYADYSDITTGLPGTPVFQGNQPMAHALYLGFSQFLDSPAIANLNFFVEPVDRGAPAVDPIALTWEIWTGAAWTDITPNRAVDSTSNLRRFGVIEFGGVPAAQATSVAGISAMWVRCRLRTPITSGPTARPGMVRAAQLPTISTIAMQVHLHNADLLIDQAYSSSAGPIDVSKDFYPFGEKPAFNDTLWLASEDAFANADAAVTLSIVVSNAPGSGAQSPPPAVPSDDIQLRWEAWNGTEWVELGISRKHEIAQVAGGRVFSDTTKALSQNGEVRFVLPPGVSSCKVNGNESYWIRVRIISGNYGVEAHFEGQSPNFTFVLPTFTPPSIRSLTATYDLRTTQMVLPDNVIAENNFAQSDVTAFNGPPNGAFGPFRRSQDTRPTCYLGFILPAGRANFPNTTFTMFFRAAVPDSAELAAFCRAQPEQGQQLQLAWEYWNGASWAALAVSDGTNNLTGSGMIEFLAPPDLAQHAEFGQDAWWLRVRWDARDYDVAPRIDRILLNTTIAAQTVTVSGETLGSSDGGANQVFRTTRAPVLMGQRLTLLEPEMPPGDELNTLRDVSGPDAAVAAPGGAWVTWQEVTDFYASDRRSRHYVLDHITGEVSFGDGQYGMIPPLGAANIRLASYRTGGGTSGNRPSGSITQLKTTIPYVDKVMNAVEASGGADAESTDALIVRAPLEIRHRHRAVTSEDYEDLARLASTDVARVLCVSNRDLAADPFSPPVVGTVSLIIVPNSADAMPWPGVELVRRVQRFIADRCPVTAAVKVVGPLYVRVDVETEISLASLDDAGTAAAKVQNALAGFLHPLTGGKEGNGWAFGREPHRSDIYAVIEQIPEVDHVRALTFDITEIVPGSRGTGRFLVYSGNHKINLFFGP
jgi:hypothetical protein